ncbi:MAG: zf-HC2 domain-containing protein [Bryobacteraceae bacterium]
MEHHEAEKSQAVEKYLLGELPATEREAFEEHYFSCPECAEEVRAGLLLQANAAAVLRDEAKRTPPVKERKATGWFSGFAMKPVFAASFVIVCLFAACWALYESMVVVPRLKSELAELRTPQPFQDIALRPLSRGEGQTVALRRSDGFVGLRVYIDPQSEFPTYRARIVDAVGALVRSIDSPAPGTPGEPLLFLMHKSSVPPGTYTLTIYGLQATGEPGPGVKLEAYRFAIKERP